MDTTLHCPDCQAQLMLPALPDGQTVQCPRCQNVFEPARLRASAPSMAMPIKQPAPSSLAEADDEPTDEPVFRKRVPAPAVWQAHATRVLLALSVLGFGLLALAKIELMVRILDRQEIGIILRGPPAIETNLTALAHTAFHLTFWPALIFFLVWVYRAHAQLPALKVAGLSHSPVWAVASFFIPIANFFVPFVVLQEIWRASHPRAIETPIAWRNSPFAQLVRYWWFLYLGAIITWMIGYALLPRFPNQVDGLLPGIVFKFLSNICAAVAGVLLIEIIRQITQRQQERHRRLYEDAA